MPIERVQNWFFQDSVWSDSLTSMVLPELVEWARPTRLFRVWSPACGTGEELYSVSLMLSEMLPDAEDWSIFLTGTDIDDVRLTRARRGAYAEGALKNLTREERACYFRYNPNTRRYGLRPQFIRNAHFGYRVLTDVSGAPPTPGRFDLILCPDAVASLPLDSQNLVLGYFADALSERGALVTRKPLAQNLDTFSTFFHAGLFAHKKSEQPRPISSVPSSELPTQRPPAPSGDWSHGYSPELSFAQRTNDGFHVPSGV